MTDLLPKPTGLSQPSVPDPADEFFNQDFSKYGMPEKNLEIGGKDAAVGLAGSTMKALGTGIAETSMGGLARGARGIVDGTLAKGIADSVAEKVNPDGTGLLDGMVSFSPELQEAKKSDPIGWAASTVGNAIGDAAEWVGDKADKVIQPVTKTIGSALKSGGESVIKNGTSADYQEAVGRELYTGNSLSTLKLGSSAGDPAVWAAKLGMNLQSSTLKDDETGEPFHIQQAKQIRAYRQAWKEAGHTREPRVSVSRSIFALMDDRDRMYFGSSRNESDSVGYLDEKTRAIFGRSYAAEPDKLVAQLKQDEAIAEADTLLLTVPNQLGVEYNVHVIESILKHVAPAMGWRDE